MFLFYIYVCVCVCVCVYVRALSCSVMTKSLRPHGLQLTRLLYPWDSPGKNTGVSCHFLLQGIFLTQELNPHLLCPKMVGGFFTTEPLGKLLHLNTVQFKYIFTIHIYTHNFVYIHIHMHVYVYTHVCVCVYIYIYFFFFFLADQQKSLSLTKQSSGETTEKWKPSVVHMSLLFERSTLQGILIATSKANVL